MTKRIYIAGPMTGYPDRNREAFAKAAKSFRDDGWDVIDPANQPWPPDVEFESIEQERAYFLRKDILALLDVAAIALLPNWFQSIGARVEFAIASALGLDIFDADNGDILPLTITAFFDEYQGKAHRTAADTTNKAQLQVLAGLCLGLTGEAGEVADTVKKSVMQGHPLSISTVIDELGDVLWYIAELADFLGYGLSAVASDNIRKLETRYPDGFTTKASQERAA